MIQVTNTPVIFRCQGYSAQARIMKIKVFGKNADESNNARIEDQDGARLSMEISSTASQALALKENMSQVQLGVAAVRQAAQSQEKLAEMLAQKAASINPPEDPEPGRLDTYA